MTMIDLHREQPAVFDALSGYEALLEQHYRDMQVCYVLLLNGMGSFQPTTNELINWLYLR